MQSEVCSFKTNEIELNQARRKGGSRGSNEPPLEVNNRGLKTQTVDFQLLANSGGNGKQILSVATFKLPYKKRLKVSGMY